MCDRGSSAPLVVFTKAFPYGSGEQFLETEVPYLARSFSQVVLVPSRVSGHARAVPESAIVDRSLVHGSSGRILRATRTAVQLSLSSELYAEIRTRFTKLCHPSAWRRVLAEFAWALRVEGWIRRALLDGRMGSESTLYTYWLGATTLGAVWAKRRSSRLRVVSRAHHCDLYEEVHPSHYLPFRSSILSGSDKVYAVSDHGAAYLRSRWARWEDRVEVARLGVRASDCDTRPSDDEVVRIVSCSFLTPVKRVELLIDALVVLARTMPDRNIRWTHIGDGPLGKQVREYASQRLPGTVKSSFLGSLENREVLKFYRQNPVDVFVNVSASEGVPVSIMEAQSFGVPVVATAVGGTPEIVSMENGILLPENSTADQIADGLSAIATGSGVTEKRTKSKETWRELACAERNYADFARLLKQASGISTRSPVASAL